MEKPLLQADALEKGGSSPAASAASAAELSELRAALRRLKLCVWALAAAVAAAAYLLWYSGLPPARRDVVNRQMLLASIPIVALLFTWFHIWLAIQMMFLPLRFVGLWQYGTTGVGIGWQGVVPRKCEKMARTAYSCASPYLERVEQWLKAVSDSEDVLLDLVRPHITAVVSSSLDDVLDKHWPDLSKKLSPNVRKELADAAVEKIEEYFSEMWGQFSELLCDRQKGIENDGMVVSVFTQNKELLNHFFMRLGASEFRFIERCGAALGFFCGIIQLVAFNHLDAKGRAIFLPGTGFFLGIVTNWLAILACFKPVFPHPIRICGWHICTVQGLFLKRQKDVAVQYSELLCDHFFDFHKVVAYLQTKPELWSNLKTTYLKHNGYVFNATLGRSGSCFAPIAFGRREFKALEADLMNTLVQRFAEADELHRLTGNFIQEVTDIRRKNAVSMQNMPPDKFEDLLHPVFKEDEWILILLGGVLGAIVGAAQVYFLST